LATITGVRDHDPGCGDQVAGFGDHVPVQGRVVSAELLRR
jgi:hypothetical protein